MTQDKTSTDQSFDRRWYVRVSDKNYGPYTGHEIQHMVQHSKIVESDYVYPEAGSAWVEAKTDPILRVLFKNNNEMEPTGSPRISNVKYLPSQMRGLLTTFLLGLVALLAMFGVWLVLVPIPSTADLDADLEKIRAEIKQSSDESEKYSSGAMKALIELRKKTFQNSEAMLSQKRDSVLRRVNISYRIDGSELRPASDAKLNEIKQEIEQANQKLVQSQKNAQQYTGGLVQVMALMTVETDQFSVSQLYLKYYSAKYGLPLYFPEAEAASKPPPFEPGTVVKDREAL